MRILLLIALLVGLAAPAAAAGRAAASARRHFNRGVQLYQQAQYREAISEFEAAYRARPHGVVHYNLAQCHEKLGELAEALEHYEAYLREVPKAEDREAVARLIATLGQRLAERSVARLQVRSEPPGARVTFDGQLRGTTPYMGEHEPGPHQVDVSLEDHEPVSREVQLEPGGLVQLELSLVRRTPPPQPAVEVPAAVKPAEPAAPVRAAAQPRRWTWVAASASGVALAGAVTLGLLAQGNSQELLARTHDRATADQLYQSARSYSTGANVLYGVAGVAGAASVAFFFVEGSF